MTAPPALPKIYHITHVDNLTAILAAGGLVSDKRVIEHGGPSMMIGMSNIKKRRVEEIEVSSHPGTKVGDYVPFYFCPRSIMLYVIYRGNHPELTYRGGQDPIVHLEADLHSVVACAKTHVSRWAFSLSNAGAYYTEFRGDIANLTELNWNAIQATDFRDHDVKEGKQAEFLLHDHFPLELIERIGTRTEEVRSQAEAAMADSRHRPPVQVLPQWYF